jgi:MoaA/NifB/PqqE/SkfB family radical SAM enzyme
MNCDLELEGHFSVGTELSLKFIGAFRQARHFVEHPDALHNWIETETVSGNCAELAQPKPDPYNYQMTHYRGFVRFPERLRNYLLSQSENRDAARRSLPTELDIEPSSRCNFRCTMCQLSEWPDGRRAGELAFNDLKALIDAHPQIMDVKLQGVGEPLFNKSFFDMVRYMVDRDIWVRTTVNGSLLHVKENARRLIDSGIGEIQTSFDGASKQIFEAIRLKSDFDLVVRNLTDLNDYANRQDRPITRMWAVLQNSNRHQVFDFVELAKRMQFRRLTFSVNLGSWGSDEWNTRNSQVQATALTDEETYRLRQISRAEGIEITCWHSPKKFSSDAPGNLCPIPFQRVFISSDLRVVPCGGIGNPEITDFGPASELRELWNGRRFTKFREAHIRGRIPKYCQYCYETKA